MSDYDIYGSDGTHYSVYTGGGGGGFPTEAVIVIIIAVAVIYAIFTMAINYLTDKGILKSKYTVTLEESYSYDLNGGEVTLTLSDTDEEREYTVTFTEEGESTTIKVHKGTYAVIAEYKDFQYNLGYKYFKGTGSYSDTVSLYTLNIKAILLKLEDEDGTAIYPETVSVYLAEDGSVSEALLMENGCYVFLANIDFSESGTLELQAEGYESVVIEYSDLSAVTKLTVQLEEAS